MQLENFLREEGIEFWTSWEKDLAEQRKARRRLFTAFIVSAAVGLLMVLVAFFVLLFYALYPNAGKTILYLFGFWMDAGVLIIIITGLVFLFSLSRVSWTEARFKEALREAKTKLEKVKRRTKISIAAITIRSLPGNVVLAVRSNQSYLYVCLTETDRLCSALKTALRPYPARGLLLLTGLREETVDNVRLLASGDYFIRLATDTNGTLIRPSTDFWVGLEQRERGLGDNEQALEESINLSGAQ